MDYKALISQKELTEQLQYYLYHAPGDYSYLFSNGRSSLKDIYLFCNEQLSFKELLLSSRDTSNIIPKQPKEKKLWKLLNIRVFTKQPKGCKYILYKDEKNINSEIKKIAESIEFYKTTTSKTEPSETIDATSALETEPSETIDATSLFDSNFDYSDLVSINDQIPKILEDTGLLKKVSEYFNSKTQEGLIFQKFYSELKKSLVYY